MSIVVFFILLIFLSVKNNSLVFFESRLLVCSSNIINGLKLNIENYIPSPLSTSLSSLTKDEKELGTICIDLGHSTSSISIFSMD